MNKEDKSTGKIDDNWSLNNKYNIIEDMFLCHKDTIKSLRDMLIEDIDSIDCTDKSKLKKWQIIVEVLEIIDKRFGVIE